MEKKIRLKRFVIQNWNVFKIELSTSDIILECKLNCYF